MAITFEALISNIEREIGKAERRHDLADDLVSCEMVLKPLVDDAGNEFQPYAWHDKHGNIFPGYVVLASGYPYTVVFRQLPLRGDDRIAHVALKIASEARRYEQRHILTPIRH
ncbi:hypothetical protein [Mesorhizobium sp. A623]